MSCKPLPRKRPCSAPQIYPETAAVHKPTPQENAIAISVAARRKTAPPEVTFTVNKVDQKVQIQADHPDQEIGGALLMNGLGSTNRIFIETILSQLVDILRNGSTVQAADLNRMFALVQGIAPRDETEGMLAAQMAAIHNATMTAARRFKLAENIPQQDSSSNMLNKLARTFAAQIEALKKYRSTGEQNIKVQHVTVNEGGQAIVGNVAPQGGGGGAKSEGLPHGPSKSSERGTPMQSNGEKLAPAVPSSSIEGLESVPVPRGTRRCSEG